MVTLDGSLFASGTAVSALGDHVLVVSAEDAAGNRARREVRFGIRDQVVVSVALGDVRIVEGDVGDGVEAIARVPVRLSVPAPSAIELEYTTVSGTALADEDFTATAGTIAFAAGEREATIEVRILADDLVERAEDFVVAVTGPAAIAIPDADAEIAIEDDDVPGLQLTKTDALVVDRDGDGTPSPADTLGYTVTARNTGSATLSGVMVQDPPPSLASVVAGSVATTQGTIESSDPVRIAVGALVVGAEAVITFQVEIAATLPAGVEEISNQAVASANEVAALASDDPRTAPVGDATVTPLVAVPNLAALLRARLANDLAGDGVVGAGDELTFTATLRNTGPIGLTAIVFEAPIPALTELVEAPGSTGGAGVRFEVAELAGGAEVEVWFRVRLAHPWGSAQQVFAQGTVRSAELAAVLSDDPAEAGAANPTVVAVSVPSCTLTKVDALVHDLDGHGASAGDTVEYRLAMRNLGAAGATQLRLRDELPIGVDLVPGSVVTTRGVVESEEPVAIAIGTLGVGELIEVRFRVVLDGTPVVFNQAWLDFYELAPVASDDPDQPGPADPTRTEVGGGGVAEIPALDTMGLILLAVILAAACLWTLRRSTWNGA